MRRIDYLNDAENKIFMTRQEVYSVIDSERDYQDSKWDNRKAEGKNPSSWILWMEDYLDEAKRLASRNSEADDTETKMIIMGAIRKVTALGVAAMEYNDAPKRVVE